MMLIIHSELKIVGLFKLLLVILICISVLLFFYLQSEVVHAF
jgi:hypothetical protein